MHNKRLSKTPSSINTNSQAAEQNPKLAYRPFGSQIQKASAAPVTQSTKEDVAFAEQKMEAFGLELQAKYGKITPEGQERLTVLQAKMASFSSSQLEHARRYSHNIANIPLRRPDTPIQAKLTIGEPGDKYEQEADETARQVVQRIHQPQSEKLQRESLPDEEELQMKPLGNIQRESLPDEEEELQMKPMVQRVSDGGMAATQDLEASINQARGGGQPLAKNIREPMEQGFGADFSRVKVHTDTQSDQLNRAIQAKAFTTGQDVFFRQGAYEPGSRGGQELLAHELTHVVQQNGATAIHHQQTQINKLTETSTLTRPMQLYKSESLVQRAPTVEDVDIKKEELLKSLQIENEGLKKENELQKKIIEGLEKDKSELSLEKSESKKQIENLEKESLEKFQKLSKQYERSQELDKQIAKCDKKMADLTHQEKDEEIKNIKQENRRLKEQLKNHVSSIESKTVEGSVKGSYADAMGEVGNNAGLLIPGFTTASGLTSNNSVAKGTGVAGGSLVAIGGLGSSVFKLQEIHAREKGILGNKSESTLVVLSGFFNLTSGISGVYSAAKEAADDPQIAQAISDATFAATELIAMIDLSIKQLKQEKRIPWLEFLFKFMLKLTRLVGLAWEVSLLAKKVSSDDKDLTIARSMSVGSTIIQLMLSYGDAQKIQAQKESIPKQKSDVDEREMV